MKLNNRNKYLLLAFLLTLLVSYRFAVKNTFEIRKTFRENIKKQEISSDIPGQLLVLSKKECLLDKRLQELNVENTSIQNSLLKFLNAQASKTGVKIIDFNSPHKNMEDNTEVETYIFNLEGSYTNIIRTLNSIENNGSFGAITHVSFEKKRDRRSKRAYLQVEVFLEQMKSSKIKFEERRLR